MKIGVDIRPLLDPYPSGVGEYTRELLTAIFRIDKENEYHLFANSHSGEPVPEFNAPNATLHYFRYPNKLLNASLRFFDKPKLDRLISGLDLFFMPNLNFVALDPKTPLILTAHDLSYKLMPSFYSKKQQLWHKMVRPRELTKQAAKIIAVSEHTKQDLVNQFSVQPDKIEVVYHGIADDFFERVDPLTLEQTQNKYDLPGNFILFLAELQPRKNTESVLEAFELLRENPRFSDLHLVLAGKASSYNSRELENGNCVHLLDYVPKEDRPALYKLARAFVYPSYYEGFGLPPLEAMAQGTPVIASHTASLGEILGKAALLIDPYNVRDLYRALEQVLTDQSLAQELSDRGREHSQRFTWDRTAKATLRIFKNVAQDFSLETTSNLKV